MNNCAIATNRTTAPLHHLRGNAVLALAPCCAVFALACAAQTHRPAVVSGECAAGVVPLADHHQHLVSRAGLALLYPQPLDGTALPDELARVVSEIESRWNDPAALAKLMTDAAVVRTAAGAGWARGRAAASEALGTLFARPYRITPVAFGREGRTAHVEGFFTRGDGAARKHFGSFQLVLMQAADGRWRVDAAIPVFPGPVVQGAVDAKRLVELLDEAGIRKGVVLSDAYWFDSRRDEREPDDTVLPKVRAENDWTAAQVAQFPDRLVAFCSFNPLREYALAELNRCVKSGSFRGLKLHFNTSGVNLHNADHLSRVRLIFETANHLRMPVILHARTRPDYGAEEARIILEQLVAAAPDVPVQIAHLWGGEAFSEPALAVYAEAVASGDARFRNLYFDVAELALVVTDRTALQRIADRMRQIGMSRILYGSDGPETEAKAPREAWALFRSALPLTDAEVRAIAANLAPYLQ